ncbi:MAG TPA: hypothetical protein VGB55_05100, partial [Tepidisphaeraceae bacterium]
MKQNKAVIKGRARQSQTAAAMAFLAPNLAGFLVFTLVPLVISLAMAFSNWDLSLHNRFKDEPIKFVGLDNFRRLLDVGSGSDFWRYLGNTGFFMLGLPPSIAASLIAALMLSKDLSGGSRRAMAFLAPMFLMIAAVLLLSVSGAGALATSTLVVGLFASILLTGLIGRVTLY